MPLPGSIRPTQTTYGRSPSPGTCVGAIGASSISTPIPVTSDGRSTWNRRVDECGLLLGEEAVRVGETEEPFVHAEPEGWFVVRARMEHDRETPRERRDCVERGEVQVRQHDGRIEPSRVASFSHGAKAVETRPLLGEPRILHVRRRGQPPGQRAHRDRGEPFDVARRDCGESVHGHTTVVVGSGGKHVGPVEIADRAARDDFDRVAPRRHPRGERPASALGAAGGLLAVAGHDIEQPHPVY